MRINRALLYIWSFTLENPCPNWSSSQTIVKQKLPDHFSDKHCACPSVRESINLYLLSLTVTYTLSLGSPWQNLFLIKAGCRLQVQSLHIPFEQRVVPKWILGHQKCVNFEQQELVKKTIARIFTIPFRILCHSARYCAVVTNTKIGYYGEISSAAKICWPTFAYVS